MTFGNRNRKFHMGIFLFPSSLAIAFWYVFVMSLKAVYLYFMKSNCCIYSYIPNYSFFIFYFWWLLRIKNDGIFKTGLLSFQYWLLDWFGLVLYNMLLKQEILNNISLKLTNIFQVFSSISFRLSADIQLIFNLFWEMIPLIVCATSFGWVS